VATINEGNYLSDVVKHELDSRMSREEVAILAGSGAARQLKLGQVIGKRTLGAVTTVAETGNSGDGDVGTVTLGPKALAGDYVLTCVEAATDAGRFKVIAPDGNRLDDLTVGVAYSTDHINLTVEDGEDDWASGDFITVSVAAGDGKVVGLDLAAENGSQIAYGVMIAPASAPEGADGQGVAVFRDAVIAASKLVWPDGATEGQKEAALAQLAERGIVARAEE